MSDQISAKLSSKLFLLGTMASVPIKDTQRTDDKFLTKTNGSMIVESNKPLKQMNKMKNDVIGGIYKKRNINLLDLVAVTKLLWKLQAYGYLRANI